MASPLYLNQLDGSNFYINNAKILASFHIPIGDSTLGDEQAANYQTLHVIDSPVEFAYANRRQTIRDSNARHSMNSNRRVSLDLDELGSSQSDQLAALLDFYERSIDLSAAYSFQAQLYQPRLPIEGTSKIARLTKADLNLERLIAAANAIPRLRSKLHHVNESLSLNTYFLPVDSDQLRSLSDSSEPLLYEAHILPDQVAFLRTIPFGSSHESLFNRHSILRRLDLNLAKTRPGSDLDSRLSSSPLILQAKCGNRSVKNQEDLKSNGECDLGVTSSEIVLANIPIRNGVLHLIRKPILPADTSLLNYLNNDSGQLSEIVNAFGSRTSDSFEQVGCYEPPTNLEELRSIGIADESGKSTSKQPIRVDRFLRLLTQNVALLSSLTAGQPPNQTILAPSNEAFSKLRYDIKALVMSDEQLVPSHWSSAYRQSLIERLIRRHVIQGSSITSDLVAANGNQGKYKATSEAGSSIQFVTVSKLRHNSARSLSSSDECQRKFESFRVEADSSGANLIQRDLIGRNGVLHMIDQVLGEEQETIFSLLTSLMIKFNQSLDEWQLNNPIAELNSRIQQQTDLFRSSQAGDLISAHQKQDQEQQHQAGNSIEIAQESVSSAELQAISKMVGQFLDDLASNQRKQFELLASSVNISSQLARLTSFAASDDESQSWEENSMGQFRAPERQFTLFMPTDLAWLRLAQSEPAILKPLMHFLYPQSQSSGQQQQQQVEKSLPKASQSSQRIKQVSWRTQIVTLEFAANEFGPRSPPRRNEPKELSSPLLFYSFASSFPPEVGEWAWPRCEITWKDDDARALRSPVRPKLATQLD